MLVTGWEGETPAGYTTPEVLSKAHYVNGVVEPLFKRGPMPDQLPAWLPEAEFKYLLNELAQQGFDRPLNWYRARDITYHSTEHLGPAAPFIKPALFVTGEFDPVIFVKGEAKAKADMEKCCTQCSMVVVPGAGHWIQQEKPKEVNDELLAFMNTHRTTFGGAHAAEMSGLVPES